MLATGPAIAIAAPHVVPLPRMAHRAGAPQSVARPDPVTSPQDASCTLMAGRDLSFGLIPASGMGGTSATSWLTVSCSGSVTAHTVLCDSNVGPSGTFTLTSGASAIHFGIEYSSESSPAARIEDCALPGITLSGVNPSAMYRLVGTIAASAPPEEGTYADTITASVTYQ